MATQAKAASTAKLLRREAFGAALSFAAGAVAVGKLNDNDLLRQIAVFLDQDDELARVARFDTGDDEADDEALRVENDKWWALLDSIVPTPTHTLAGVKAKAALWGRIASKLGLEEGGDQGDDFECVWARALASDLERLEG